MTSSATASSATASSATDCGVIDALEEFFGTQEHAQTLEGYLKKLVRIRDALERPFTRVILDASPDDVERIRARWPNPVTFSCTLGAIGAALTHAPALAAAAGEQVRDFWRAEVDVAGAAAEAVAKDRAGDAGGKTRAQIPDLVRLRAVAASMRDAPDLETSQTKTLFTLLSHVPVPSIPAYVRRVTSADDLRFGENAVLIPPATGEGAGADADQDDHVAPIELVLQDYKNAGAYGPIVRVIEGEFARHVRASFDAYPRAELFVSVGKRKGDAAAGVHDPIKSADAFGAWARRRLQTLVDDRWTLRGATHAWPTQCVCLDPGPHQTPDETIFDLARQTGRSARAVVQAVKDGGPEERATWPAPLPVPAMRPAHLPPPTSLRAVEDLHGADVDLAAFAARADETGHATLESSMRTVYLAMVADAAFSGECVGLGTVAVPGWRSDSSDEANEGSVELVFTGEPEHARIERAAGAQGVSEDLGAAASENIRRSLAQWPRAFLFGDNDGADPKRMNAFWQWSTDVLSASTDRTVTAFGVRCAKRRSGGL